MENSLEQAFDGREFKFMFLPDGHDPDTLVAEEGAAGFEERLKSALPLSDYLVQQLSAEVDLNHEEGRARLKALAAPLFARMPEGIYRELLADRLAARVSMPAAALKSSFAAADAARAGRGKGTRESGTDKVEPSLRQRSHSVGGAGRTSTGRSSTGRASAGRGNMLTQAITLVLHHPSAAHGVATEALGSLDRPGIPVLRELLETAASMEAPSTAILLERWRNRPEYARLSALAISAPLVADSQGAAKELQMAVEKLIDAYGPGRRMDELLRKAQELGLNYDEKAELSLLLQAKGRPRAPH